MVSVAHVLAQTLKEAGIDVVCGLPGGENAHLLDALRLQGIDFVLVRNESSALYMADARARLTGTPAVALTTLGPGATNAYCGLAHAYLDRSPLLLLTAQSDGRLLGRHTHQVIDVQAIFEPVTKMTREVTAVNVRQTVQQALSLCSSGRPGPVHLGLGSHMATQTAHDQGDPGRHPPGAVVEPQPAELEEARDLLGRAQRPLVLAGLGLEPQRPYDALRQLAERASAPVVVTPKAKGALSDDHPLSAGVIGLTTTDPAYDLVDEADCLIAVGFDVVELVRPWDHEQPMIWVAPWPNDDPRLPTVRQQFVGNMAPVLRDLSGAKTGTAPGWPASRVATFRRRQARISLPQAAPGTLRPQSVLALLRRYLPRQAVVTTDVGSHKILAALQWPTYLPNTYLLSNGLSAMGYGLPAAIAAAQATGRLSLCLTGDGGLNMVLGELGLLRELELPVLVVVMNDGTLDLIRSGQRRRGLPAFGTEFRNPQYDLMARSFDLDFYRLSDETGAAQALRQAVTRRRPALIEAVIDPHSYPTTPR